MTTDRDMERAQSIAGKAFVNVIGGIRYVDPTPIASALAAERAPLEAQVTEARAALRDLLAGLSPTHVPRRAAIVERVEEPTSAPPAERDELQIAAAECDEMVTRADLDAFRGEIVAALREAFPIGTGYGDPPSIAHGFRRLADKLETGR